MLPASFWVTELGSRAGLAELNQIGAGPAKSAPPKSMRWKHRLSSLVPPLLPSLLPRSAFDRPGMSAWEVSHQSGRHPDAGISPSEVDAQNPNLRGMGLARTDLTEKNSFRLASPRHISLWHSRAYTAPKIR